MFHKDCTFSPQKRRGRRPDQPPSTGDQIRTVAKVTVQTKTKDSDGVLKYLQNISNSTQTSLASGSRTMIQLLTYFKTSIEPYFDVLELPTDHFMLCLQRQQPLTTSETILLNVMLAYAGRNLGEYVGLFVTEAKRLLAIPYSLNDLDIIKSLYLLATFLTGEDTTFVTPGFYIQAAWKWLETDRGRVDSPLRTSIIAFSLMISSNPKEREHFFQLLNTDALPGKAMAYICYLKSRICPSVECVRNAPMSTSPYPPIFFSNQDEEFKRLLYLADEIEMMLLEEKERIKTGVASKDNTLGHSKLLCTALRGWVYFKINALPKAFQCARRVVKIVTKLINKGVKFFPVCCLHAMCGISEVFVKYQKFDQVSTAINLLVAMGASHCPTVAQKLNFLQESIMFHQMGRKLVPGSEATLSLTCRPPALPQIAAVPLSSGYADASSFTSSSYSSSSSLSSSSPLSSPTSSPESSPESSPPSSPPCTRSKPSCPLSPPSSPSSPSCCSSPPCSPHSLATSHPLSVPSVICTSSDETSSQNPSAQSQPQAQSHHFHHQPDSQLQLHLQAQLQSQQSQSQQLHQHQHQHQHQLQQSQNELSNFGHSSSLIPNVTASSLVYSQVSSPAVQTFNFHQTMVSLSASSPASPSLSIQQSVPPSQMKLQKGVLPELETISVFPSTPLQQQQQPTPGFPISFSLDLGGELLFNQNINVRNSNGSIEIEDFMANEFPVSFT